MRKGHYNNSTDVRVAVNCMDKPHITDRAKVVDEDRRTRVAAPFMSYGEFTGLRAPGHVRVLADPCDGQSARDQGERAAADPGGVDDQ